MLRRDPLPFALALALALVLAPPAGAWQDAPPARGGVEEPPPARVTAELSPREATVGDPLTLVLTVELPAGVRLASQELGPELGAFRVLSGAWDRPVAPGPDGASEAGRVRVWRGTVAAYRTGELELPAIRVRVAREGAAERAVISTPIAVQIVSVLEPSSDEGAEPPELADLKPPASIEPDFRPLWVAGGILVGLLAAAGLVWWLSRRYGAKLRAAPVPSDPFHRTPPHVWVYAELQRLLERRLAEEGRVEQFYESLAWILKRYLGGRYRLDLMERTTAELPGLLRQAGAPDEPSALAHALLEHSDLVKFAKVVPATADWRSEVDRVYRIVDATRPAGEPPAIARSGAA